MQYLLINQQLLTKCATICIMFCATESKSLMFLWVWHNGLPRGFRGVLLSAV